MSNLPDKNKGCPYTGFARSCRSVLSEWDCPKYIRIIGVDPNTGQEVDETGCADGFLPMLLIENSQQQRQTGAAVESFRNEMVKANEASNDVLLSALSLVGREVMRLPQADESSASIIHRITEE